jgi:hypothetical protein
MEEWGFSGQALNARRVLGITLYDDLREQLAAGLPGDDEEAQC